MRLKEGLTVRKIGEDYVIVSPEQGMVDLSKVYSLNETAALLWEEFSGKDFTIDDLIRSVRSNYDVDDVSDIDLRNDMNELISFFEENNLLDK